MATSPTRHVGVVYNPIKIDDEDAFRATVSQEARDNGFDEPRFWTTTKDDPGYQMSKEALEWGPDLVLVAGGDGTVRVVTTSFRESDTAVGIIPMGTGNLMARNFNIPLDAEAAITTAFTMKTRKVDLVKVYVDGADEPVYYTGMAGIGFDAKMMDDTNEKLKKIIGAAAYVISFANQLENKPNRLRFQVDGGAWQQRKALMMMVGNTRQLHGGIELFPEAQPDDGKIDLLVAAPRGLWAWTKMISAILHKKSDSHEVEFFKGSSFTLSLDKPILWEVDGDTLKPASTFVFEVDPKALTIVEGPSK